MEARVSPYFEKLLRTIEVFVIAVIVFAMIALVFVGIAVFFTTYRLLPMG